MLENELSQQLVRLDKSGEKRRHHLSGYPILAFLQKRDSGAVPQQERRMNGDTVHLHAPRLVLQCHMLQVNSAAEAIAALTSMT